MSRVLLINPPIREFARPNNPPLGLLYIASYLEQNKHHVDVCDLNATRQLTNNWVDIIEQYEGYYDIIGLSGLITTYNWQRVIIDYLNHRQNYSKLIIGGGMATFAPDFVTRNYPEVDIIVLDEGEETLLGILKRGLDYNGVWYQQYNKWYKSSKSSLIADLDKLPFPDFSKVPVEEVYLENAIWGRSTGNSSSINYDMKRSLSMIMSRGCPFSCKFCAHAFKVKGCSYRMRSVDNVIAEIDELVDRYNIDFIGFLDDNTCYSRDWMVEFCIKLIEKPYNLHWGCSARVDEVDKELLKLMRHANCEFLGYGAESVNSTILKNMRKGNSKQYKQQAEQAIRYTKEAGIYCNCTFIAGFPGETWETIRETAEFMKVHDVLNNIFFATGYPSTDLYRQEQTKILDAYSTEDNYIKSLGDATEFKVNFSELADDELHYARACAINGRPDLISKEQFDAGNKVEAKLDPLSNKQLYHETAAYQRVSK